MTGEQSDKYMERGTGVMIRFATIGSNFITDWFLEAAVEQPELIYEVAYSRKAETAQALAEKYHANRTCTSLQELAEDELVDAVYIASPNSVHYEQAALMLSHGKHVLCEKTITSNSRELEALIEIAGKHGVVVMEAIRTSFTPGFAVLKDNLDRVGTVRHAGFNFCKYSSRYDSFRKGIVENAFNPALSNGALMDIGVYCVHPMVRLFGEPQEIKAEAVRLHNGVDGAGTILAKYDGMLAELVYSKVSSSRVPSQIQGEDGTLVIHGISTIQKVLFYDRAGNEELLYQDNGKADMAGEIREWIALMQSKDGIEHVRNHCYSRMALSIMDEARKQTGIVFPADTAQ